MKFINIETPSGIVKVWENDEQYKHFCKVYGVEE